MLNNARITVDPKAVGRLLRSDEVRDALLARGEDAAAAAGPGFEAKTFYGFDRVSVIVAPTTDEAIRAVRQDSTILTSALDAARG
jgi:hypothetical protein